MNNLNDELVKKISELKGEPKWMLDFRLNALKSFFELDNPDFGPKIEIDFSKINYYKKVSEEKNDWDEVDAGIKNTFKELGVIDAEENYFQTHFGKFLPN